MKGEYSITIESDEERKFMERIASARNEAIDEGVSQEDIARIFLAFADGLLGEFDEEVGGSGGSEEKPPCPSCGSPITDFEVPGIGQDVAVVPCGCRVDYDELPEEVRSSE